MCRISRLALLIRAGYGLSAEAFNLCLHLGLRHRGAAALKEVEANKIGLVEQVELDMLFGRVDLAVEKTKSMIAKGALKVGHDRRALEKLARAMAPVSTDLSSQLVSSLNDISNIYKIVSEGIASQDLGFVNTLESTKVGRDLILLRANEQECSQESLNLFNKYLSLYSVRGLCLDSMKDSINICNLSSSYRSKFDGPLVSVVMTTYNSERYVRSSIESILKQSYRNVELIVVDDGSVDGTCSLIEELYGDDCRVSLFKLDENIGTYAAKNIGLCSANGSFLTFQDSDDFSHPDRIYKSVSILTENVDIFAVSCCYLRINNDGKFISSKVWPLKRWSPNTVFFRSEVLEKIGGLRTNRFGSDSEYVARIKVAFGESKHYRIDAPLMYAASREGSLMTGKDTGANTFGYSEVRSAYQEQWTEDLLQAKIENESFFVKY